MSYRTHKRPADLDALFLRRWSKYIRLRDGYRCALCGGAIKPWHKAQAHHIYPKILYPELAYTLMNGVTLHAHHHQSIIHKSRTQWQQFVPMFLDCSRKRKASIFNAGNEHKVTKPRKNRRLI